MAKLPSPLRTATHFASGAARPGDRTIPRILAPLLACIATLALHAPVHAAAGPSTADDQNWSEHGIASYYGTRHQGRRTASGSRFDKTLLTAAHAWLPFGSRIRVTLGNTGREVVVVVTDRLYSARRVIDLSLAAARQLGMIHQGVAMVSLSPD